MTRAAGVVSIGAVSPGAVSPVPGSPPGRVDAVVSLVVASVAVLAGRPPGSVAAVLVVLEPLRPAVATLLSSVWVTAAATPPRATTRIQTNRTSGRRPAVTASHVLR